MRESGIVRSVDFAGRIVIPKEIRDIMSIKEGDPLEIVKDNNEILLRKYHKGFFFYTYSKELFGCKFDLIQTKKLKFYIIETLYI